MQSKRNHFLARNAKLTPVNRQDIITPYLFERWSPLRNNFDCNVKKKYILIYSVKGNDVEN